MRKLATRVLLVVVCLLGAVACTHSDIAREKRLASEIVDVVLDGDPILLKSGNHEFLAIYTEAEAVRGAAIILHGRGFHPDWVDFANPVRVGLAEAGWNTLSLQMPVLKKDATYYDYLPVLDEAIPRIDAGIQYLRDQGLKKIAIIAHSCGSHMAMNYVRKKGAKNFDIFVGIGLGAVDYQQSMKWPFPLAQMKMPILDVYAEDDFPNVKRLAPERLRQLQLAGHAKSKQLVLSGTDHYMTDQGEALTAIISDWLNSL